MGRREDDRRTEATRPTRCTIVSVTHPLSTPGRQLNTSCRYTTYILPIEKVDDVGRFLICIVQGVLQPILAA